MSHLSLGKSIMHTNWITTAAALPGDGASVEFMLDERECAIRGTYALGRFESRWTHYAPTSVRQWRSTAVTVMSAQVRGPYADRWRTKGAWPCGALQAV